MGGDFCLWLVVRLGGLSRFKGLRVDCISSFSKNCVSGGGLVLGCLRLAPLGRFVLRGSICNAPVFGVNSKKGGVVILSKVRKGRLPPRVTGMCLVGCLLKGRLGSAICLVPFTTPGTSVGGREALGSLSLGETTRVGGSMDGLVVRTVRRLNIATINSFRSASFGSGPNYRSVFSSGSPAPRDFLVTGCVSESINSRVVSFSFTNSACGKTIRSMYGLGNVPSIAYRILSPFNGIKGNAIRASFERVGDFLSCFKVWCCFSGTLKLVAFGWCSGAVGGIVWIIILWEAFRVYVIAYIRIFSRSSIGYFGIG